MTCQQYDILRSYRRKDGSVSERVQDWGFILPGRPAVWDLPSRRRAMQSAQDMVRVLRERAQ